jgi:phospholipase C
VDRRFFAFAAILGALVVPGRLPASGLDASGTVFIILMENHNWSSIKGSASAPFINGTILPMASYTDQYYNPPAIHPSEPNYVWLEAGTNFNISNDSPPSSNQQTSTAHLVTQLKAAGVSWKTYQENITGATCPTTDSPPYYVKHNPFAFFTDVTSSANPTCTAVMRPFTELATDLTNHTVAHYNFITPNICNDMHDSCAPTSNAVKQGDNWLSQNLPTILTSAAYQNNGLVIITWDEAASGDGPIGMIILSPWAKGGGYHNALHYSHSSTLRTLQKIFGVGPLLGGAATALDLSDLFIINAIPNADSQITKETIAVAANTSTVTWQSQPGLAYRVQWKANLTDATWLTITPDKTGNGAILSWTDDGTQTGSVPSGHRYYRVVVP